MAQIIEAYLIERAPELAPKTLKGYRNSQTRINEWAGNVRATELTKSDARQWLHARSAPYSANRDLALLRAAYEYAKEIGTVVENPGDIRRRKETPRRRIATIAELAALSEAATPIWRAILATEMLTGNAGGGATDAAPGCVDRGRDYSDAAQDEGREPNRVVPRSPQSRRRSHFGGSGRLGLGIPIKQGRALHRRRISHGVVPVEGRCGGISRSSV